MSGRNPNVKRAIVTQVDPDGEHARVLVDYMRLVRNRDRGAIQGEALEDASGVPAVSVPGVQVGDEVLVDLRPLPVVWLSFLFFVGPILAICVAAAALGMAGVAGALSRRATLWVQVLGSLGAAYAAYRFADGEQARLRASGAGTPQITAIMPRFVREDDETAGAKGAVLQTIFRLTGTPTEADWEYAHEEISKVVGVQQLDLHDDRVEVIFHGRMVKEKHLFELLLTFSIPVELDRELEV